MSREIIKFSIICPVYNSELYLTDCIESVTQQNYSNWELILINDGSTDRSGEICNLYSKKDNRIILINQNNTGQFVARLNAIKKVTGDYVLFLDSDDKLNNDALNILASVLLNNKTDIVWFSYSYDVVQLNNIFYLNDKDVIRFGTPFEELFGKRIGFFLWDKCFSSKLFSEIKTEVNFEFKNFAEDTLMVYLISSNASSIQIINKKLYYYRFNENSKVHKISRIDQIGRDYIYSFIYKNISQTTRIEKKVLDIYLEKYIDLVMKIIIFSDRKCYHKKIRQIYKDYKKPFCLDLKHNLSSKKQRIVFFFYNKKMFFTTRLFAFLLFHGSY